MIRLAAVDDGMLQALDRAAIDVIGNHGFAAASTRRCATRGIQHLGHLVRAIGRVDLNRRVGGGRSGEGSLGVVFVFEASEVHDGQIEIDLGDQRVVVNLGLLGDAQCSGEILTRRFVIEQVVVFHRALHLGGDVFFGICGRSARREPTGQQERQGGCENHEGTAADAHANSKASERT